MFPCSSYNTFGRSEKWCGGIWVNRTFIYLSLIAGSAEAFAEADFLKNAIRLKAINFCRVWEIAARLEKIDYFIATTFMEYGGVWLAINVHRAIEWISLFFGLRADVACVCDNFWSLHLSACKWLHRRLHLMHLNEHNCRLTFQTAAEMMGHCVEVERGEVVQVDGVRMRSDRREEEC